MTTAPELIFHITPSRTWDSARDSGVYSESTRGKSLAEVGFIHCSRRGQVTSVANAIYRGEPDLRLTCRYDTEHLARAQKGWP